MDMNQLVTLHTQSLRGPIVPAYLAKLSRALRAARLNTTFPDRRRLQGSLDTLAQAMDAELYEQLYVDARSGLPNMASFTRVVTDHEVAAGSLSRMNEAAHYEAKQAEAEVYARMLAKRRYFEAIVDQPYAPLDEHRVQLRRHDPDTGTAEFRLDLTKLDPTGVYVRITIELTQVASMWRRKVIDLDADGESAAANQAFHATIYRNASFDAEHLFIHMHDIEGVSVDRVQRGVVGPAIFRLPSADGSGAPIVPAETEQANPRLAHAWQRWLEDASSTQPELMVCFQTDIAARDVREEKSNDPLEDLLSTNIQDSERARYQHTRERFPFKVYKDRKFVVTRGLEPLARALCKAAETKNLIYRV
ncbi:hypothetical protein G6O69_33055 [Pseudenhygromyxa sp. WMMC2535]|uniref:hypothetical protein n=1 Tax=Pseudenhygromyxa sp. WMMC2535 TaxID=2712867 RepID=UPI00155238DF|nr:hypothetical protein [Pseudenhygromyxa sp. WMMC2535]NVB42698.1 hypothetical protein [Pseudenhygromyxa sp. WMMC2535]